MDKKTSIWIIYALVVTGLLFVIELWLPIAYFYKVALKIFLFLLPLIWVSRKLFEAPEKDKTKLALWLGIGSLFVIQIVWLILGSHIDLMEIKSLLADRQRITAETYIYVAIYAVLGNSILEEVFFRGILVQNCKWRPWIFSSALFSFYHLTIFISWFPWWITLIALFGLFVGGLLFCWLNGQKKSIWNSWLIHIFADIAIFGIGFQLYF